MTICMGALALVPIPISPCIVLCFDSKIAANEFGSETEYKFIPLNKNFVALVSDLPGRARELAIYYREYLRSIEVTEANVTESLGVPLQRLKRRLANSYVQRRLGVSYDDFLANGHQWFGPEVANKYRSDIESHPLRVDMIFAGFIGAEPVICELSNNGEIERLTNYSIIGVGKHVAEPVLHARGQTKNTAINQTLYNLYEAKKLSEGPFVGQQTSIVTIYPSDEHSKGHIRAKIISESGGKALDKLLKRYGPKPLKRWPELPKDALRPAFFNIEEGY